MEKDEEWERAKEGTKKGLEQELFKPLHEEKRVDKAKTHTNHEQDDVQQALVVLIDYYQLDPGSNSASRFGLRNNKTAH